jgi:hypothetical protein
MKHRIKFSRNAIMPKIPLTQGLILILFWNDFTPKTIFAGVIWTLIWLFYLLWVIISIVDLHYSEPISPFPAGEEDEFYTNGPDDKPKRATLQQRIDWKQKEVDKMNTKPKNNDQ